MDGLPALLVIDLDGTLLDPSGQVSLANRTALAAAREAGVPVMIATGRTHAECGDILRQIEYAGPLVIASGAALVDWPDGRTLERATLDADLVQLAIECIQAHGFAPLLLMDADQVDTDYLVLGPHAMHPVSRWWFESHGVRWQHVNPDAPESSDSSAALQGVIDHTLRVASIGEPGAVAQVAAAIDDRLGNRVTARHWPAVGRDGERVHMLEIFRRDVDKWTMVQRHCRRTGIAIDRVAAIGDGLNDIDLIAHVGFGIAVANAHEGVHAVADAMTDCHSLDGVASAIKRLLVGWT